MSAADEALGAGNGLVGVCGDGAAAAEADEAAFANAHLVDLAGEGCTRDGESGTTFTLFGEGGGDSLGE